MSTIRLLCLALDGPPGLDMNNHIFPADVKPDRFLNDLQRKLKENYYVYKNSSFNSIEVWVLEEYVDRPTLLEFDPGTATTYNGVPLVKMEPEKRIREYFPEEFDEENRFKIHLIAKRH